MNHIPGDSRETVLEMKQLYQHYTVSPPPDKLNPFDKEFLNKPAEEILQDKDGLFRISFVIGY